MITQTRTASRQFLRLVHAYGDIQRYQALRKLRSAFRSAAEKIEADPKCGVTHTRPYPQVASRGFLWVKVLGYWIAYSVRRGHPVITNIFYETADIPNHVAEEDEEIHSGDLLPAAVGGG